MINNYTFLTDHSYSLRPAEGDNDELPLNRRKDAKKNHKKTVNSSKKITSPANRTVSIDRSSSDKENNSSILSNSVEPKSSTSITPIKKKKSSTTNIRSNKKKPVNNRRYSTQSEKKKERKLSSKINITKKSEINRNKTKSLKQTQTDLIDTSLLLSIEERVKLRRTKPLDTLTASAVVKSSTARASNSDKKRKESIKSIKSKSLKPAKISKSTKKPTIVSAIKTKKLFLGSGLDLDNIVLGNRQRRCVQT